MIKKIDLSGTWKFAMDADKKGIEERYFDKELDDSIRLPGTTSIAKKGSPSARREIGCLTDPYLFEGYAWYSREVAIDPAYLGKNIFLNLERTRLSKVWVDAEPAGSFDSLTTPHRYDLTNVIKSSKFKLTILVSNVGYPTGGGHLTSPDTQTNWNGIIGDISLNIYEKQYISEIKTYPDIEKKSVKLRMKLVNSDSGDICLSLRVKAVLADAGGILASVPEAAVKARFPAGESFFEYEYPLGEDAVFWSEYSPAIYRLSIFLGENEEMANTSFGLRKIEADKTRFFVNGTPIFLRGKHDGLIFPLTGAFPTDLDEWMRVMGIAKSYGINHYRYHTCCPPDAAFEAADLLGIYMEPQLPFWGTLTAPEDEGHNEEEQRYLIKEGFRMLDAYGNHASYCLMSLGNELWGSKERMSQILAGYRFADGRHLYTQGSNNFQHAPVILPEDDFFVGVRFSKNRLIRGSYGMCDAPLGHVQAKEPSASHNYDEAIRPTAKERDGDGTADGEIEIQYGTGVKKVKADAAEAGLVPNIPVVSHEIGQYCVYPNFKEIGKYSGVLKPYNLETFRSRLEERGMLGQADSFFEASGRLAVQCYKEELEAAARSSLLAGYQILDIQDFTGQGTALVGILDAFMDSKGLVSKEEWSGFCSDAILLAEFDKYIYSSGEPLDIRLALRYYNPKKIVKKSLHVELIRQAGRETVESRDVEIPDGAFDLTELGHILMTIPQLDAPEMFALELTVPGTRMKNGYELYCYPKIEKSGGPEELLAPEMEDEIKITGDFYEAEEFLERGKRVLYMPNEVKEGIDGFYCTDFWCYPMFRDICVSMNKPVAIGTMGLLIDDRHAALSRFPSHMYATPQWYGIVSNSRCAILDDAVDEGFRPIVQMIDNFERNHKLGVLFEGMAGSGRLMVCTSRLGECLDRPEALQFLKSILEYMASDDFAPAAKLDLNRLRSVFV